MAELMATQLAHLMPLQQLAHACEHTPPHVSSCPSESLASSTHCWAMAHCCKQCWPAGTTLSRGMQQHKGTAWGPLSCTADWQIAQPNRPARGDCSTLFVAATIRSTTNTPPRTTRLQCCQDTTTPPRNTNKAWACGNEACEPIPSCLHPPNTSTLLCWQELQQSLLPCKPPQARSGQAMLLAAGHLPRSLQVASAAQTAAALNCLQQAMQVPCHCCC